jgi:hypothetical protein
MLFSRFRDVARRTSLAALALGAAFVSAGPVEYVKICSLYGAGFYYIPGTDICMKVGGYVEGGWGYNHNDFSFVNPGFNVNGSGGVYGAGVYTYFGITGTPLFVGPRIGGLWGNMSGSTYYVAGAETNSVKTKSIYYYEGVLGTRTNWNVFGARNGLDVYGFVGGAQARTEVTSVTATTTTSYTTGNSGWTTGIGVQQSIDAAAIDLYLQYRYVDVGTSSVFIPGRVDVNRSWSIVTAGAGVHF